MLYILFNLHFMSLYLNVYPCLWITQPYILFHYVFLHFMPQYLHVYLWLWITHVYYQSPVLFGPILMHIKVYTSILHTAFTLVCSIYIDVSLLLVVSRDSPVTILSYTMLYIYIVFSKHFPCCCEYDAGGILGCHCMRWRQLRRLPW